MAKERVAIKDLDKLVAQGRAPAYAEGSGFKSRWVTHPNTLSSSQLCEILIMFAIFLGAGVTFCGEGKLGARDKCLNFILFFPEIGSWCVCGLRKISPLIP